MVRWQREAAMNFYVSIFSSVGGSPPASLAQSGRAGASGGEGLPEKGHVILKTARFEVFPGDRTKLTIQSVFQSVADRDGMLRSSMEKGVNESYDRLDELLASVSR